MSYTKGDVMNKSNKYYNKALNYYQEGYIENAIKLCEKSISSNMKNKAAIDLKGLLYYLKGDITSARALWKLNWQVNKDKVAKKYLEGLENDEEKLIVYIDAVKKINSMKINEALEGLLRCESSDFNIINVNNSLCTCYIKQGEFEKAKKSIEKVIKIDKCNYTALENRKILTKYGELKSTINIKPYFYGVCALAICFIIFISAEPIANTFLKLRHVSHKDITEVKSNDVNDKKTLLKNKAKNINNDNDFVNIQFPYDEFKKALDSKDYEKVYNYTEKWKNENLQINYKEILSQGEKLLSDEGVVYFYKQGTTFFNNRDYNNGSKEFLKAFSYGSNSYLYPHIIYFTAFSYENLKDYENALKFYSVYDTNFSKGDYEEIVLYNMAIINKDIDMGKARQYAIRLSDNYPHSIYNNSAIKSILKN